MGGLRAGKKREWVAHKFLGVLGQSGKIHRGAVWLSAISAVFCGAVAARGDIVSVVGRHTSIDLLFSITFTESTLPQDGWAFQIFLDTDNDLATGYGAGFECLVRGVEYVAPSLVYYRTTLSGSGPGGWGNSLATLPVVWVDDRHVEILLHPLSLGLPSGNIRYTLELYRDGCLIDDVRLARTINGGGGGITDCNHNGVADATDITNGTSDDCDGNSIPDECDAASGPQADCNQNGVPDLCDIADGTSTDCTDDGVPDECELDCNGNGVGDSCDITDGTSADCDGDLSPDECAPTAAALGCRWLGVHPPAGPRKVAIRVTGDAQNPEVSCVSRYVQIDGRLGLSPFYQFPQEWCTAYVHGTAIMPNARYTVQLIDGVTFFAPQVVTTSKWADVDGNGLLNVTDVQAIVLYIAGSRKFDPEAVDIGPCVPDGFVNVTDVQTAVLAFGGLPYASTSCLQPCQ